MHTRIGLLCGFQGPQGGKEVYGLNTGGSWKSDGFRITMVPAAHTSEIMGEGWVSGPIQPGSGAIGFVLDIEDGRRYTFPATPAFAPT